MLAEPTALATAAPPSREAPWWLAWGEPASLPGERRLDDDSNGPGLWLWSAAQEGGPAVEVDGRLVVVLDGALVDRRPLAPLAEAPPVVGAGDAAWVLAAWRQWGPAAIERLKGVYGLVVWDGSRDTLYAVRDRMGVQPLFFATVARDVVVSTWLDGVVGHPRVSRALNRAALAEHLCYRWPDRGETFYTAVRRVSPAHRAVFRDGVADVAQYWDPTPTRDTDWLPAADLPLVDEILDQAVERSLAPGRAGIFLSGGLDSISLAVVAAELARRTGGEPPLALSVAFAHPDCDETEVQRAVAAGLGIPQQLVAAEDLVGPAGYIGSAMALSRQWSAPLLSPWLPIYHALGHLGCLADCRVVISGAGGDDWLTVNPDYMADLLRRGDLVGALGLGRSMVRSYRVPRRTLARVILWRYGLRPLGARAMRAGLRALAPGAAEGWLHRRRTASMRLPDWLAPDPTLRAELLARLDNLVSQGLRLAEPQGPYGYYLATNVSHTFADPFLSMEHEERAESGRRLGVPHRATYFDEDLVSLLCRVPPDLLLSGGREKGLVRGRVARRLPGLDLERQRKQLSTRWFDSVVDAEVPGLWRDMSGLTALANEGIVDARLAGEAATWAAVGRPEVGSVRVWDALSVESWIRGRHGGTPAG